MNSLIRRQLIKGIASLPLSGIALPALVQAQAPQVIRFGVSNAGVGNPPRISTSTLAIAQSQRVVEEEFRKEGIRVDWIFFKGEGPAVNEALSNNQLDFATQGGLPAIVGRSVGLDTRAVFISSSRANTFLLAGRDSPIKSVTDLRGKRIAFHKGTATQLAVNRILSLHGLSERDVRVMNLDPAASQAALQAGDLDAIFGAITILRLREAGAAKLVFTTRDVAIATSPSQVVVNQAFAIRYPELTQRTVKALVRAAQWVADERNREDVFATWSKGGSITADMYRDEYAGVPLAERLSPVFDPFVVARMRQSVEDAHRFRLIRRPFDVDAWIDTRYLDASLKELGLDRHWPRFDAAGKRISPAAGA